MSKTLKTLKSLILSLIIFCMVCPAVTYAGATPELDIVLDGDFTDVLGPELLTNGDFADATPS